MKFFHGSKWVRSESLAKINSITGLNNFVIELSKAEDDWDRYLHDELILLTHRFGPYNAQNTEQKKFITVVMEPVNTYVSDNSFNPKYFP